MIALGANSKAKIIGQFGQKRDLLRTKGVRFRGVQYEGAVSMIAETGPQIFTEKWL